MKVLTSEQIKLADQFTITQEPISSIDLMERAAEKCCEAFPEKGKWNHLLVVCGIGNNGGDGLAIARMQLENYKSVRVMIIKSSENYSDDFMINLDRWKSEKGKTQVINSADEIYIREDELVVDAILGTGVNRPVSGFIAECIESINRQASFVISIDMPSGLISSAPTEGTVIEAGLTLTIGAAKPALFFPENSKYVGKWELIEIYNPDLSDQFVDVPETIDLIQVKKILKPRSAFSHKGTFGKALLICGSRGKFGAAVLASRACMRSGVGLLTTHVPSEAIQLLHHSVPEALIDSDRDPYIFSHVADPERYDCIGIGPGMGTANETIDAFIALLKSFDSPMVIDADALNILAEHPDLFSYVPSNSILTPHPKEFERLFGECKNSFEFLEKQLKYSALYKIVIVRKGMHSVITTEDGKVFFNMSGNPSLAKGGSGDVLTGILTALFAQGYSSPDAAKLGVFVHGYAADLLVERMHESSVLASDLIEALPAAFLQIERGNF